MARGTGCNGPASNLYSPPNPRPHDGSKPEFAKIVDRQPGSSDTPIETPPQQHKLDPGSDTGRARQAYNTPFWIYPQIPGRGSAQTYPSTVVKTT